MQLFRGDNIFNKYTNPGLYRNNGLRSKAFGSGCNPANIEKMGLTETIRKHISPIDKSDKTYYDVSDFLSFSESIDRAFYWCKDKGELIIERANEYYETRYIFAMNIDDNMVNKVGDGIYKYEFACNPKLKTSDTGKEPQKTIFDLKYSSEICPICMNLESVHRIFLINSHEYLIANKNQEKYIGALESSKKDNEWLVLPSDPLGSLRSARIPRADFWAAEHYMVIGEERPELVSF